MCKTLITEAAAGIGESAPLSPSPPFWKDTFLSPSQTDVRARQAPLLGGSGVPQTADAGWERGSHGRQSVGEMAGKGGPRNGGLVLQSVGSRPGTPDFCGTRRAVFPSPRLIREAPRTGPGGGGGHSSFLLRHPPESPSGASWADTVLSQACPSLRFELR